MTEPRPYKVLIVDDEKMLRESIARDLKRRGYVTFTAENGHDAFEVATREKIDLVISDIRMPNGDGVELLERLKAASPETPAVILLTAFADLTAEDAYAKGAAAIFTKPFDRKALAAEVDRTFLSASDRWKRGSERVESAVDIELQFPELNIAMKTKTFNIGRGGMFVALEGPTPEVGAIGRFRIALEHGTPGSIEGVGIVRWIRKAPVEGAAAGLGIEFRELTDECRKQVIALIASLKTKSFIPNG